MKTEKERIINGILKDELEIRIQFKKHQEAHMFKTSTPLVMEKRHWFSNQFSKHVEYLADKISDRLLTEKEKKTLKDNEKIRMIEQLLPNTGGWSVEKKTGGFMITYFKQKLGVTDLVSTPVNVKNVNACVNKLTLEMEELEKEKILEVNTK